MPLNKNVISKPNIYKIVEGISKVSFNAKDGVVYGFTKEELQFAIDEILMICDFHSTEQVKL